MDVMYFKYVINYNAMLHLLLNFLVKFNCANLCVVASQLS